MKIRIIIPCYNESKRIGKTVFETINYLDEFKKNLKYDIMLVDDGSADNTLTVIKALQDVLGKSKIGYITYECNRGKGYAVRSGMIADGFMSFDWLIYMDADGSSHIKYIVPWLMEDCKEDIIITDRELPESVVSETSLSRRFASWIFYVLRLVVLGLSYRDTQNGLKAFRVSNATSALTPRIFLHCQVDGFSFDAEILYLAKILDYGVKSVPVIWLNDKKDSRVRFFRDSWKMFWDLLRIRRLHG
jgi:glycosyltransferase involved in cell wall biosynthesis